MTHLEKIFSFRKGSTDQYEPLSNDETGVSCPPEKAHKHYPTKWMTLMPWVLTAFFSLTSLVLGILVDSLYSNSSKSNSFGSGFATDFVAAREYIQVEQRRFYGGPAFDEAGKLYIPDPDLLRYVGDPVQYPEVDDNWDNMTWGRYILITENEARATWGDEIEEYWDHQRGGYVAGLDMFHTLHCLNNLRKTLYPDYYVSDIGISKKPENRGLHQEHCIEQIRQYVMCSGDMTPTPTKYYKSLGRNYVDSDVIHTCRNFKKLRDWMVSRYHGENAIEPVF